MDITNIQNLAKANILNANENLKSDETGKNNLDFTAMFQNYSVQGISYQNNSAKTSLETSANTVMKTDSKNFAKLNDNQGKVSNTVSEDRQPMDQDDLGQVKEFCKETMQAIEDATGMDEDSIKEAMEELGLGMQDLLQPTNLANLVANLTGTDDAASLLLDENFSNLMNQITELTQNLTRALGMDSTELSDLLSQFDFTQADGIDFSELLDNAFTQNPMDAVAGQDGPALPQEPVELDGQPLPMNADPMANADAFAKDGQPLAVDDENADAQMLSANSADPAKANQQIRSENAESDQLAVEEDTSDDLTQSMQKVQVTDNRSDKDGFTEEDSEDETTGKGNSENSHGPLNNQTVISQPQASFAEAVDSASSFNTAEFVNSYSDIDPRDILEQFTSNLKVSLDDSQTSMEMQLNPQNLGKILLQVSAKEGSVTANITTQNELVKEALETQLADLRESLNTQGVKVDAIEVTVSSHAFEKNLDGGQQREQQEGQMAEEATGRRRSLRMDSLDDLAGLMTEEEMLVAQIMRDNGNTMDLTA